MLKKGWTVKIFDRTSVLVEFLWLYIISRALWTVLKKKIAGGPSVPYSAVSIVKRCDLLVNK